MVNLIVDIKPIVTYSAYVEAPFDKAKEALEKEGYHVISSRENAQLRMQEGKDAFVSRNGNRTREAFIYNPKTGIFLTNNSPIMANAQEATNCHRNNKEFYLTDAQVEESLADCVELSDKAIPTNRFAENQITVYAFGNVAEQYGQFLKSAGIKEMPIWLANLEDKPFARQMWLLRLVVGSRSVLNGNYRYLNYDYGMRGVRQGGEATAKNLEASQTYTIQDIQTALKTKGLTGIESILIDSLRQ
ncbi:hypothetical protein HYT57_00260 [Candidatus Woesearchaeota archaeon]|nr:hypothetical protein [Candidatus Woesearchaeota archaeon]